ncbi:MAG: bifunctional phosphoglucose/phosphomannose isomerase [Candidatus Terrybacteria bacterium RIFCSPHIGHO2_01_FULL_48_17]|uniref:Bifunctional phosphoglucose/phosphomannose isomerase n=1 Tax=Candidatus Terrybacteria bacterium RIFCSPHIGHO2_01_FULL_48_17 TaxID=1802362 RepID=A0A1G2PHL2_9BACT|nr:MAG: bifunctional phosphoglucose/phosphomannose isomerase [Candidatus Terrybacteria bacterium RIFCSPHIGHO2_01_FULL_48_17]OHA53562.1 MAG: bifunctional phosphoglucose/phosphomannose isomerase [Candidatus Terrybacteria bacterium RIFCSPLOWO2_01_FULL_48_14]
MRKRIQTNKPAKEAWKLIRGFPAQFSQGLAAGRASNVRKIPHEVTHVIVCGMGGSALAASIFEGLRDTGYGIKVPIAIHRDYGLPHFPQKARSLVLVISYSGNTEEALSAYDEARKRQLHIVAIASGGKLAERARRDGVPLAQIPTGIPPRFATGVQFGAFAMVLTKLGLAPTSLPRQIAALERQLNIETLIVEGKKLARLVDGRIPMILGSSRMEAVAYSWKTNINENAKIPAFMHAFPELNHNEVNIYDNLSNRQRAYHDILTAFILQDPREHTRIKKRMRITTTFIKRAHIPFRVIKAKGETELVRIFYMYVLGLAFSSALAERLMLDAIAVNIIEDLKKKLAH